MKEANSPKAANTYTLDFFSLFILFYIGRDTFNHRLELFFYSSGITVWSPIYSKSSRKQHIRNKDILKEGYSGKSPLNFRWKQYTTACNKKQTHKKPPWFFNVFSVTSSLKSISALIWYVNVTVHYRIEFLCFENYLGNITWQLSS